MHQTEPVTRTRPEGRALKLGEADSLLHRQCDLSRRRRAHIPSTPKEASPNK